MEDDKQKSPLASSLELPCGVVLKNRLAKSAMSENMARNLKPGVEFVNAYRMWVEGGAGLLISGNVMVDSRHLGEPHNVVIEKGLDNLEELRAWSTVSRGEATQIWLQLNHPGKQSPKFLNKRPVAPSAISMGKGLQSSFNTPRELMKSEIQEIVDRFAFAAKAAQDCGFQGVQIHGAHGYLVSQFLSPQHNQRNDEYGGSIENRTRFLKEIYLKMRGRVGAHFPIGIKINSADFSRGGFSNEEAIEVTKTLSELGIDLIEVSGGSYESPVMTGITNESTRKREAYFLEYTREIKNGIQCPLMVTGGFRTATFIDKVLKNGELDLVGLARPLALNPTLPKKLLRGEAISSQVHPLSTGFKKIDKTFPLEIVWYTHQIHRMGRRIMPNPKARVFPAILKTIRDVGISRLKRMRT